MDTLPEIPARPAPEAAPDFAALDAALNGAHDAVRDLQLHVEALNRLFARADRDAAHAISGAAC